MLAIQNTAEPLLENCDKNVIVSNMALVAYDTHEQENFWSNITQTQTQRTTNDKKNNPRSIDVNHASLCDLEI